LNKGDRYISQGVKDMLDEYTGHAAPATANNGLSVRESNILALLAEGKKSKQIADELGISIYTLHNHKTNIRHKLKLQSNRDITFMAIHQARGQKAMRG
jgi:DNA-binding NarL/FixJ family response regulator